MKAYNFSEGLTLSKSRKIDGSVIINGNLSGNGSLEVCGNLHVNGDICIDNIKVYGNLVCHNLDVCSAFCGGDMQISGYASATDIVCTGNISIEFICAADTVSTNSNASICYFQGETIKAKKKISCHHLSFSKEISAGNDLICSKGLTSMAFSPRISVRGKINIG